MKRYLCLRCNQVSEVDPDNPPNGCPLCRHNGIPADLDDDTVTVETTWHELRVLVIWAEFWAGQDRGDDANRYTMQRVVKGIADRLHRQHLDKRPLTFTGDLAELEAHPDVRGPVEIHGGGLTRLPTDVDTPPELGGG